MATRRAETEEAEEYGARRHPEAGTSVHDKGRGRMWLTAAEGLPHDRPLRPASTVAIALLPPSECPAKAGAEGGRSTLQVLAVGP